MVVFLDSGDTIIDEGTEIRDERDIVIYGECIPGAQEAVRQLHEAGYALVMVADGMHEAFINLHGERGSKLWDIFDHIIDSETVGVAKPDARMFQAAMDALGLTMEDRPRVAMFGNNLKRDIVGANQFGIISVHQTWSPRYDHTPKTLEETPDYVVKCPGEWVALCDRLESELHQEK